MAPGSRLWVSNYCGTVLGVAREPGCVMAGMSRHGDGVEDVPMSLSLPRNTTYGKSRFQTLAEGWHLCHQPGPKHAAPLVGFLLLGNCSLSTIESKLLGELAPVRGQHLGASSGLSPLEAGLLLSPPPACLIAAILIKRPPAPSPSAALAIH